MWSERVHGCCRVWRRLEPRGKPPEMESRWVPSTCRLAEFVLSHRKILSSLLHHPFFSVPSARSYATLVEHRWTDWHPVQRNQKLPSPLADASGASSDTAVICTSPCIGSLTVPLHHFNALQSPAVTLEEAMLYRPRRGTLQPLPGAVLWILTSIPCPRG